MSAGFVVAKRVASADLQEQFAALCGDRNPMHMDAVASRRTQAGQPVVHGIHALLWALETLAAKSLLVSPVARIRVRLLKWMYLGDEAVLTLPDGDTADPKRLHVMVAGLLVLSADLTYGELGVAVEVALSASPEAPLAQALDLTIEQSEGVTGEAFTAMAEDAARKFPALAKLVGGAAVAEMAATSYVVGMEAPGLHSMFSKADFTFTEPRAHHPAALGRTALGRTALHWEVIYTDARFHKARIAIAGSAIQGTLEVFFRAQPVQQAGMDLLKSQVQAGEFNGMRALIIGGSRGLGELTAKIVAAGGGVPVITYAVGRSDAEQVQEQISAAGGVSELMTYDVQQPAAEQVKSLTTAPTHVFYFATQTIYRPKQGVLSGAMLAEFVQFYLQGFYDLCTALLAVNGRLVALYPSTVFIDERPAGMTEYAMIKAAGEVLCADMNHYLPGIKVVAHRFPKLRTDQTAGVLPERETDAIHAVLPVLRELMSLASPSQEHTTPLV